MRAEAGVRAGDASRRVQFGERKPPAHVPGRKPATRARTPRTGSAAAGRESGTRARRGAGAVGPRGKDRKSVRRPFRPRCAGRCWLRRRRRRSASALPVGRRGARGCGAPEPDGERGAEPGPGGGRRFPRAALWPRRARVANGTGRDGAARRGARGAACARPLGAAGYLGSCCFAPRPLPSLGRPLRVSTLDLRASSCGQPPCRQNIVFLCVERLIPWFPREQLRGRKH